MFLLLLMVAISWGGALLLERKRKHRKPIFVTTLALLIVILGIFKYTGFFLKNLQLLTGFPSVIPEIALPIGISFYTFQLISYVTDVYRGEVEAQRKYWLLLLYAGLFHQCVAGPILRYQTVCEEIAHRTVTLEGLSRGVTRFTVGLAKKAVLANYCGTLADRLLVSSGLSSVTMLGAWLGGLAYMLEIYLDFSAYSDMAIGMGLMCGFHYPENFNYPYVADSVTDFWRRWHISLSSFFRDYVYIPLGGNRCTALLQVRNMLAVWALTGFWHGASWNFVFWGLYYFLFLVLEKYALGEAIDRIPTVVRHGATLLILYLGCVLFRFESLSELGAMLAGLIGLHGISSYADGLTLMNNLFFLVIACLACTPLAAKARQLLHRQGSRDAALRWADAVVEITLPMILLLLALSALAGDSYNPFLYFNF